MAFRLRPFLVILTGLSMLLGTLGQVAGSFDDDDPDNDPNVCSTSADPENCDWTRGWFQAAVNTGHISVQAARTAYPDIHRTDWLPEEVRREREAELERSIQLYEDDDPTNDPNSCFESTDPDCDWARGWYVSLDETVTAFTTIREADPSSWPGAPPGWLEARREALEEALELAPGEPLPDSTGGIGWFCPPGVRQCSQPSNQCGPNDDPTLGECYFHN